MVGAGVCEAPGGGGRWLVGIFYRLLSIVGARLKGFRVRGVYTSWWWWWWTMAREHRSDVGRMLGVAKRRRSGGGAAIASMPTVAVQGEGEGGCTANNTILLSVYSRVEGEMLIALSTYRIRQAPAPGGALAIFCIFAHATLEEGSRGF